MSSLLPKRLGKYGLELHLTKTRLLQFRPHDGKRPSQRGSRSFEFLGFVHYWARSKRGARVMMRKTASGRFGRAVKRIYDWCRTNRHRPLSWQHRHLVRKLRGHDNYHGITGNYSSLYRLGYEVRRAWMKWLGRRSNARTSWVRFECVLERYPLPPPVLRHWVWAGAANPWA